MPFATEKRLWILALHHKVDRLFPEESSAKEGKIDQKLKRTELFRGDGPVAVFIEQSERFFEFGDLQTPS